MVLPCASPGEPTNLCLPMHDSKRNPKNPRNSPSVGNLILTTLALLSAFGMTYYIWWCRNRLREEKAKTASEEPLPQLPEAPPVPGEEPQP